jgi:heme iron utilization protein
VEIAEEDEEGWMNELQAPSREGQGMSLEEMLASFDALRFAVLATSDDEGRPYTSLIAFALTADRRTLLFATSRATSKYRNLTSQPAVSILIDNRSQSVGDLKGARAVTLLGSARELRSDDNDQGEYQNGFKERHPELAAFVESPATAFFAVSIERAVHVTRFEDVSYWP